MKKLIIPIAIFCMALASCSEKAPSMHTDFEYTIEDIENDPNWVEITDVEEVDSLCLTPTLNQIGAGSNEKCIGTHITSNNQHYSIWNEQRSKMTNLDFDIRYPFTCAEYKAPDIDFNEKDVIHFGISTHPILESNKKLFKNESLKKVIFVNYVTIDNRLDVNNASSIAVGIPKLTSGYNIYFGVKVTISHI